MSPRPSPSPTRSATTAKTATKAHPNNERKKQAVLNKFLTKSYHMIDQCDPEIAGWSTSGDSFTVRDVESFERQVLPQYFNHSKFSSFTRQLNFYGFQKIRLDADLQRNNSSVRFYHENFQRGKPDLLQKISRTTAKVAIQAASSNDQIEALKTEVAQLHEQLHDLNNRLDERVDMMAAAIKTDYAIRMQKMEAAYADLYASMMLRSAPITIASSPVLTTTALPKTMKSEDIARYLRSTRA